VIMNKTHSGSEEELRFFATAPRPCSYLPGRSAISVFADPDARFSMPVYNQLAEFGFRRSGNDLYVPACPGCSECVPVRVPVSEFKRSRNQQRVWQRNRDLDWEIHDPAFAPQLFPLYRDYLQQRHAGGGMDDPGVEDYLHFLTSDWCDSLFLVGRLEGRPVVVAVTDKMDRALSAVYTFFDTTLARRSLGTLAILRQVELARAMQRDWLYLGYWIAGSDKMHYKNRFRPLQGYRQGSWVDL
jgi:arginyl-tRNA--protein-N-Asp/Glu arginylyltransferase